MIQDFSLDAKIVGAANLLCRIHAYRLKGKYKDCDCLVDELISLSKSIGQSELISLLRSIGRVVIKERNDTARNPVEEE